MGKKENAEVQTIRMKVEYVIVDRTQYKPYTSQLSHPNLYVEIPVEKAAEITQDNEIVLSLDGLADIMVKVADAITTADDSSRVKRFGH